jgi:hypothetical protein
MKKILYILSLILINSFTINEYNKNPYGNYDADALKAENDNKKENILKTELNKIKNHAAVGFIEKASEEKLSIENLPLFIALSSGSTNSKRISDRDLAYLLDRGYKLAKESDNYRSLEKKINYIYLHYLSSKVSETNYNKIKRAADPVWFVRNTLIKDSENDLGNLKLLLLAILIKASRN